MDWQFTFAAAQLDAFLGLVRTRPEARDAGAIARSAEASGAMMRILDAELTRTPWLSGEQFGIGDIPMGVYAYTYFTLAIDRPALPAVEAWYQRLKARPGFAQVAIPLT
jgi:glutathione S-transferase